MSEVPKPVTEYKAKTTPEKCEGKMRISVSQNANGEVISWQHGRPRAVTEGALLIFNPDCYFKQDLFEIRGEGRSDLYLDPPEFAGEPEFNKFRRTVYIMPVLDVTDPEYRRYLYFVPVSPMYNGYKAIVKAFNSLEGIGGLHITHIKKAPVGGKSAPGDNIITVIDKLLPEHKEFIAETVWPTSEEVRAAIPSISRADLIRSFNVREAEKKMLERKAIEAESGAA